MLSFCTLFDSNYLTRGLSMYYSLIDQTEDFHLYIYAFDEFCVEVLNKLALPNVTVVPLAELEDASLLRVKPTRTKVEYCWTCTSSTILYTLKKFGASVCTYLDADLFFFSEPSVLVNEMGSNSILLTSHRYTKKYDKTDKSGKYCVQFISFRNDKRGTNALNWWREVCLDWCYARNEDGKFGDQKYLDDWLSRFEGVHELEHLGGGVAPWNIQQYQFTKRDGQMWGLEKATKRNFKLVFYHFHDIRFLIKDRVDLGFYFLPKDVIQLMYKPYLRSIMDKEQLVSDLFDESTRIRRPLREKIDWKFYFKIAKRKIKGIDNRYTLTEMMEMQNG